MEILVCVKQVPDDSVEIHLKDGAPDFSQAAPVVNAFDTYALEMAVRLKEAVDGTVTVLSIGPESAKNSLKNCLAVGASKAFLVSEEEYEHLDTKGIGEVLKGAIEKIEEQEQVKFDVVFCGRESTDYALGQVGSVLAEELGVGVIQNIVDIEKVEENIVAKQETEEGYRQVETAIPCVVTVNKPTYDPRYPTIKSKMAARKIAINEFSLADVGKEKETLLSENLVKVVKVYEPAKKAAGVKIKAESVEDAVAQAFSLMEEAKVL